MDKKTLQKMKASLLALLATTTLSGCNQNTNQQKNDKPEETLESTQIDYIETTTKIETEKPTTKETLNITTESKPITTTYQIPSMPYTWYTTSKVITPEITTTQTEITALETTQTEENTLSKRFWGFEGWYGKQKLEFKNEIAEIKLDRRYPTIWDLAQRYCPAYERIEDFCEKLRDINSEILTTSADQLPLGTIIQVPVTRIYITNIYSDRIGSTYTRTIEQILPGTTEFKDPEPSYTKKYTTAHLYKDNYIIVGEKFHECKARNPEGLFATVSIVPDENNFNTVYYREFLEDGGYNDYAVFDNIKDIEVYDGIPIFKANTLLDAYMLSYNSDYVYQGYTTVVLSSYTDKYTSSYADNMNFYKDKEGNIWLTFFNENLTKYGFELVTDEKIIQQYYREDGYFAQDESGYSFSKFGFTKDIEEEINKHLYPDMETSKTMY